MEKRWAWLQTPQGMLLMVVLSGITSQVTSAAVDFFKKPYVEIQRIPVIERDIADLKKDTADLKKDVGEIKYQVKRNYVAASKPPERSGPPPRDVEASVINPHTWTKPGS